MVEVTKRFTFAYAHRLHNVNQSDDWNKTVFGKCNNENGHGHNAELEVTVDGDPNIETGMIINFNELKAIVDAAVIQVFDHKHLDKDLGMLYAGRLSTCENTIEIIWNILDYEFYQRSSSYKLKRIRLSETESSWCVRERSAL